MIAELGVFSLILALFLSLSLVIIPLIGLYTHRPVWMRAAKFYALGQFLFIALAYGFLTLCFLFNDFSVIYVLSNSSVDLLLFRIFYEV